MIRKAYKFRIYPDHSQEQLILRTFGCARFVWNLLLADAKKNYEKEKKFTRPTPAQYKDEYEFLKEIDSMALCNTQVNLNTAFARFFKDRKDKTKPPSKKSRFPRFKKKKKTRKSYTTNCINNSIRIEDGKLRLPKLGLISTVFHRRVEGVIKSVTVSQKKSGKFYASILTEQDKNPPEIEISNTKVLGLDFSFSSFFVTSTGVRPKHVVDWANSWERRIAKQQKRLSRKEYGSRGYEKQRKRVARLHEYVANHRRDVFLKCIQQIFDKYDVVVIEDIDLKAMVKRVKHRKFGKAIHRLSFGLFRQLLLEKAEERGKIVAVADKFYPSSQLCSCCGFKNKKVKNLNIRHWTCPECGTRHDRDINAAKNLVKLFETFSTGASPGSNADGGVASVRSGKATGKQLRRSQKSCKTVDFASLCL